MAALRSCATCSKNAVLFIEYPPGASNSVSFFHAAAAYLCWVRCPTQQSALALFSGNEGKGETGRLPTLCDHDSTPNWALAHTISRDPHGKGGEFLTSDDIPPHHAPAILTLLRTARNVREYPVKVPEMGKRST